HSELVRDFAERLAAALGLPFAPALRKSSGKRPQKEMQNSAMQLRNVLKAFQIMDVTELGSASKVAGEGGLGQKLHRMARKVSGQLGASPTLPSAPVLLVDDMVDSGWTLTLAATLL